MSQEGHLTKLSPIQLQAGAEYDRFCICLRKTSHPLILKGFGGGGCIAGTFPPPKKVYFDI